MFAGAGSDVQRPTGTLSIRELTKKRPHNVAKQGNPSQNFVRTKLHTIQRRFKFCKKKQSFSLSVRKSETSFDFYIVRFVFDEGDLSRKER